MDHIFIQNPGAFVFGKRDMTGSERPQTFMDAEKLRIAGSGNQSVDTVLLQRGEKSSPEPQTTVLDV